MILEHKNDYASHPTEDDFLGIPQNEKLIFTPRSVCNSIAAGYCAGISGTIIGHPLDSLKVWLQTGNNTPIKAIHKTQVLAALTSGSTGSSATSTKIGNNIVPASSSRTLSTMVVPPISIPMQAGNVMSQFKVLYAGVSGPLVTVGLIQSINFALYDSFRRILYAHDHPASASKNEDSSANYLYSDSLTNIGISSMATGVILSIITNPLLLVKTRQQTASRNGRHLGFLDAFRQIYSNSYAASSGSSMKPSSIQSTTQQMFRGYAPHFVAEVIGRGVYFVSYEYLKRSFVEQHNNKCTTMMNDPIVQCSLTQRMISAAVAGTICWSVIYPFDAVRSRMFVADPTTVPSSTYHMIRYMYKTGGVRSFFRGYFVTMIRAGPVAAFVLPVYDISLERISKL
jgi:Mitochondrial carrier protein